jgi:hypothetical protein
MLRSPLVMVTRCSELFSFRRLDPGPVRYGLLEKAGPVSDGLRENGRLVPKSQGKPEHRAGFCLLRHQLQPGAGTAERGRDRKQEWSGPGDHHPLVANRLCRS